MADFHKKFNPDLISSLNESSVIDAILNYDEKDKIRLFVYEQLKKSGFIDTYNDLWLKMENSFEPELFYLFLIDYTTIQNNGKIPSQSELFNDFKTFFLLNARYKSRKDIIKHIFRYSCYYSKLINADIQDEQIKSRLTKINKMCAKDAYPYLMEVLEDYEFAYINKTMLIEILDTTISFIKQRSQNSGAEVLNFVDLSTQINEMLILKDFTPKIFQPEKIITINKLINDKKI